MWYLLESFGKVQKYHIDIFTWVHITSHFVQECQQIGKARTTFPEAMSRVWYLSSYFLSVLGDPTLGLLAPWTFWGSITNLIHGIWVKSLFVVIDNFWSPMSKTPAIYMLGKWAGGGKESSTFTAHHAYSYFIFIFFGLRSVETYFLVTA